MFVSIYDYADTFYFFMLCIHVGESIDPPVKQRRFYKLKSENGKKKSIRLCRVGRRVDNVVLSLFHLAPDSRFARIALVIY